MVRSAVNVAHLHGSATFTSLTSRDNVMLLCWCAPHAARTRCVLKTSRHRGQGLSISKSFLNTVREI